MADQLLSAIDSILEEDLLPDLNDQLTKANFFHSRWKKSNKVREHGTSGRDFTAVLPLQKQHAQGIGQRAEGGTMPAAIAAVYASANVALKRGYGRIGLDGALFESGKHGNAVANAVKSEMSSIMRTLILDDGRKIWSDGSGEMGRINTSTGTVTSFAVDAPGTIYMERGMKLDSYEATSGGTIGLNSAAVTDVAHATNTVTISAAATVTENDYLFREDSYGYEPMGIRGVVDDGTLVATFQNIARSGNSWWKANRVTGSSAALSEDMLFAACDQGVQVSGVEPTVIVSALKEARWYGKGLTQYRNIPGRTNLEGGWGSLDFVHGSNVIPWVSERFCPEGGIYFLHEPDFMFFENAGWKWMNRDGSRLKHVADYDRYEAYLYKYANLGATRCNSHTLLHTYIEPT